MQDAQPGEFSWKFFQDLIALVWKDRKPAFMLSKIRDPVEGETVRRNAKQGNHLVNMSGVDLSDQLTHIRKNAQQIKWYLRLVMKFIQLGIFNGYNMET